MLAWDQNQKVAHLQYLGQEDFEETKTKWSFSLRSGLTATYSKAKKPRQEYVVHGIVKVPYGLNGNVDTYQQTSWTFSSEAKMREAEASRATSSDGSSYSNKWFYTGSDDRWAFAGTQMLFNGIEAESEVGAAKGLWAGKQVIRAKTTTPQEGKGFYSRNTKIVNGQITIPGQGPVNGQYDFVVTMGGKLNIGRGHFNLSGGALNVQAAGHMSIKNGQVKLITNVSGHYLPTPAEGRGSVGVLNDLGVETTRAWLKFMNANGTQNAAVPPKR